MSFIYVDIDSAYRNRNDYPNPANFVVLPPQHHSTTGIQFKNAASNQMVLFPPLDTPPLYFTDGPTQHANLPYMFQTTDPHIVQLDELALNPTTVEDIGEIIVDDAYSDGVLRLGQADQYYTGDTLENVSTGEMRRIVSFRFETNDEFVLQSSQVLWASLLDNRLTIAVETISTLTIPVSNIFNFYRGKSIRFITGAAAGIVRLIVDYRTISDRVGLFTLDTYDGVFPVVGDTFQIVTSRRWFATVDTPFASLSSYPGYTNPLPVADLQFNKNSIRVLSVDEQNTRKLVTNVSGDIAYTYPLNTLSSLSILNSLDTDNYFWNQVQNYTFTQISSDIVYADTNVYIFLLGSSTLGQTGYTLHRINTLTNATVNNVFSESVLSENSPYAYQLKYISPYIATVMYNAPMYRIVLYRIGTSVRVEFGETTRTIVLHDLRMYQTDVYLIWSSYDSGTGELSYYYGYYNDTESGEVLIVTHSMTDPFFVHERLPLLSYVWTNQIIVPTLIFIEEEYRYELYMSDSPRNFWFVSTQILSDITLSFPMFGAVETSQSGLWIQELDGFVFCFVWDSSNGFGYTYTKTPELLYNAFFTYKGFTPFVRIESNVTFPSIRITNNDIFIVYIQNNDTIVTLHKQPFQITNAVQYRIRKNPYHSKSQIVPYTEDALQIAEQNILDIPYEDINTNFSTFTDVVYAPPNPNNFIYYSNLFSTWALGLIQYVTYFNGSEYYEVTDVLQFDPTNPTLTPIFTGYAVKLLSNIQFYKIFAFDVQETTGFNRLYLENGLSAITNNTVFNSVYVPSGIPGKLGIHYVFTYWAPVYGLLYTDSYAFGEWGFSNISVSSGLDLSDMLYASMAYGNGRFCIVGLFHSSLYPVVFYSTNGFTWNHVLLDSTIYDTLYPQHVIFCSGINLFIATGILRDTTSPTRIALIYSSDGITWSTLSIPSTEGYTIFVDGTWCPSLGKAYFVSMADPYILEYDHDNTIVTLFTLPGISLYRILWVDELSTFCGIEYNSDIYSSDNGLDWTLRATNIEQNTFIDIAWSPVLRIFLIHSDQMVYTSELGIQWEKVDNLRLLGYFPEFIWIDESEQFVGFTNDTGIRGFIYNVTEPRNYLYTMYITNTITQIANYYSTTLVARYEGGLDTGGNVPPFQKCIYIQETNNFVAIDQNTFYFSTEGHIWFSRTLLFSAPLTDFTDMMYIPETGRLYFTCLNKPYLFYLEDYINTVIVDVHPFTPLMDINPSPVKMAYSPSIGVLISLEKTSPTDPDLICSNHLNLSEWSIVLETNQVFNVVDMKWNAYFGVFIGLFQLDDTQFISFSQNSTQWAFFPLDDNGYTSFDTDRTTLGLIGSRLTYTTLSLQLYIQQLERMDFTSDEGQMWVYNRPVTHDENYAPLNQVISIRRVADSLYQLDKPLELTIPYSISMEILNDVIDTFQGRNEPFHRTEDKCYQIRLLDLVVPNKIIQTYIGNQISFYPFIFVTIQNETSNNYTKYTFLSNSKQNAQTTFKIAVSQFSNDPGRLPYIRLSSKTTIQSYFNLHKPFRFSIHLPNGELLDFVEKDNIVNDHPDPFSQISATFRFSEM